jgi:TonB-linked SusC/RagA family outer membrane protein
MAQFTFRRDGSPNFPKTKRYGYFPSASIGWRLSEESFMKSIEYIDNLKIRGSYGKMGNDLVNAFQYLTAYGFGNNYVIGGNDVIGLVESGVPNPNITWETAETWNFGFDATLWKGLLGVELDIFKTKRSDILTKRNAIIPAYTGLNLPDENIGIVENKGLELILTHENAVSDIRYKLSGNMSFARNKVIFSDEAPAAEPYQLATGRPIGSALYYNAIGIFKDQNEIDATPHLLNARPGDIIYADTNGDKIIDSRDRIRINETNVPEIVYGLTVFVAYKGFDISVLFQGQENSKQFFGSYFPVLNHSLGNFLAWRANDRWSPENTVATMPRGDISNSNNNTLQSTQWLVNAGFLRLKNVEIGYNLPQKICDVLKIQNLRLSVSSQNLFFIYDHMKDMGLDAETNDYWYYSQQRVLNFGVGLTF